MALESRTLVRQTGLSAAALMWANHIARICDGEAIVGGTQRARELFGATSIPLGSPLGRLGMQLSISADAATPFSTNPNYVASQQQLASGLGVWLRQAATILA